MIEIVWNRIKELEGETFTQIKGGEFTYQIKANSLILSRTNWSITKNSLKEALQFVPLSNTVSVQHLQAPSYVYAILMDDRIRNNHW